ncbi:methionine/alanine import family NSS transporter small subunit [uncultured Demequina sp.]|nr:methionine/alanine import family NSS transporter small subunit [uncultured Demequina sp.]
MSGDALALMLASMAVIWGGLAASVTFLARRPESTEMPEGGEDDPVAGA